MSVKDGDTFTLRIGRDSATTIKVTAVVSDEATKQGLSGRESLPKSSGMLFIFKTIAKHSMWMPDMNFALDIVWLDEHFSVSHVTYASEPCISRTYCPSYSSVYQVLYAIEMNAGDANALGFSVGKQLYVV